MLNHLRHQTEIQQGWVDRFCAEWRRSYDRVQTAQGSAEAARTAASNALAEASRDGLRNADSSTLPSQAGTKVKQKAGHILFVIAIFVVAAPADGVLNYLAIGPILGDSAWLTLASIAALTVTQLMVARALALGSHKALLWAGWLFLMVTTLGVAGIRYVASQATQLIISLKGSRKVRPSPFHGRSPGRWRDSAPWARS